jgi:SAM-dependent methyltransferase
MNILCPVCGSPEYHVIRPYKGTAPVFQQMQLLECMSCSMVFAGPVPSEEALEQYNAGYFENAHGGRSTNKISVAFFYGIARLRYAFLTKYLLKHAIKINTVLEIGPGHGYFAENWILHHPENTYLAIESDASCFDPLQKLGVKIMANTDPIANADLVVMSHVLEHIAEPASFLQTFAKKLRKGGALFIEVPCQDWKHKPLDEPHLLFFEKKTMKRLLERAGFENIEVAYYGQKIQDLKNRPFLYPYFTKARNLFIRMGILWPFAAKQKGMEELDDPYERVAVAPYQAHIESNEPAWWLRAAAIKK